jgi:hypothetical protein
MPEHHTDEPPARRHLTEPERAVRSIALGIALGLVLAMLGRGR